jgi:hypothetical protein
MKSSELLNCLEEHGNVMELKEQISGPMIEFRRGRKITGASSPIELTSENKKILLRAAHLKKLCVGYTAGILDKDEFDYITGGLALCPDFVPESQKVEDALYQLHDDYQYTHEEMLEMIKDTLRSLGL